MNYGSIVPSARLIGLVALAGFPAVVLEALVPQVRGAALAVIVLIILLAVADALLRMRPLRGLRVELPALLRLVQGREASIPVLIHNASGHPRRVRMGLAMPDGVEAEPEEQPIDAPAGTSRVDWPCRPLLRGNFMLRECFLEGVSPLGLWAVRASQPLSLEIRAYPNLRDDAAIKALRRGSDNLHLTRQIGRGREFEKLREYAPGDSSDEIHWKASARRGRPITKVFQIERTQEIYLVIDASRLSGRMMDGEPALERSLKAVLTLGAVAERRGDLFGIAVFSDRIDAFVRARGGKSHYAACRDAINGLRTRQVSPDFEEIATFLRLRLRRRSLVIFLTSLDDPVLAEHFGRAAQLLARKHLVMAATLRPRSARPLFEDAGVSSLEDVYRALAGHLGWSKLRELHGALARRGVHLALLEPASFSANLVNLYDDVKQRQLL